MKNSNKILFGGLGLVVLLGLLAAGYTRANTKIWSPEACGEMPRTIKNVQLQFDKVEISHGINVTLTQGEFNLELEATKEVMPYVNHHVENGMLKLYLENGEYLPCPVNVKMRCPELSSLSVSSGSTVTGEGRFETSSLAIKTMNGSSANLNLVCDKVNVYSTNSSDLQLSGTISELDITALNSVRIQAPYARVNAATVVLKNSSSAMIYADSIPSVSLTNSSSLQYIGQAVVGKTSTQNSSSIERIEESEGYNIVD